jgi:gamma-glutamyltranspeptidase
MVKSQFYFFYIHSAFIHPATLHLARSAPKAGQIFRNRDLADSLEKIANTYCDDFYNGTIADAIAAFSSVGGRATSMVLNIRQH